MKNLTSCFILSFLLWGCTPMEQEDLSLSGEVKFQSITFSPFSGNIPHGRTEETSDWKHIFRDQTARLEVVNINTGEVYVVDYNPNAFGEGFSLFLPYGSYTYSSEVEGGKFRRYLPFRIEGEFLMDTEILYLNMDATTDYGLITVKNEYLSSLGISHGSDSYGMGLLEDGSHYYLYVRKGLAPLLRLELNEIFDNQQLTKKVSVQANTHYYLFLRLDPANSRAGFIELALEGGVP